MTGRLTGLRALTLTVRFLSELGLIAALAVWGFEAGGGALGWVLGLGAPALAIVVWGTFVAPKATRPVPISTRVVIEVALFDLGAAALVLARYWPLGVVLAVLGPRTSVLHAAQERRERGTPT